MRVALSTIGLILMWGTVLWRADRGRTDMPGRVLTATLGILALGCTLDQPLVAASFDHVTMPNLAHVLKHGLLMLGAAGAREFLQLHMHDERTAHQGRSIRLVVTVLAVAALASLFALSPARSVETTSMTVATVTDGYMLGYWLVYVTTMGAALVPVTAAMSRFARHTEPSPVRTTLTLIATGTGIGVLYLTHKAIFIAMRLLQVRGGWLIDYHDQVSTLLVAGSVIPLALGLTWQYLARLPLVRHALAYRALAVLHPLWLRLYEATPAIALTPPRNRQRDDRPGPLDVDHCLQRRVIEIRDGALALRPFLALNDRSAEDVLARLSVNKRDRGLFAEAAWLELARRAKVAGLHPSNDHVNIPAGATDLAGEIRTLTRIAKNLPVVDAAADLLGEPREAWAR
jgi:hypothetical protein